VNTQASIDRQGLPAARLCASWLAHLKFSDIPDVVVADAKLRMLDIIGASLAASAAPVGAVARRAALRLGSGAESSILGFGDRVPAASAALANGTMAHSLDYDDTHNESVIHVSAPIVTTALAMGQKVKADGKATLTAAIGGAEITCRVGCVVPGAFHKRGFHPTGVVGTFGAAAIAGKLLDLDSVALGNAFGIAGSQASGILEFFADGSWAKRLHPGWASHAGIVAAYLASEGFTGPATVFEGRYGLFATHLGPGNYSMARVGRQLGREWECIKTSFKPYPCGHVVHPFVDAILDLYRNEGLRGDNVARITCPTAEWMMPIMCEPRDVKLAPASEYHAKFSFPYSIAAALHFGRLGVEAYTDDAIKDRAILDLAAKVFNEVDPDAPDPSRFKGWVIVETTDGRRLERIVDNNWGSESNPMTPADVRQKFRDNASLVLDTGQVEKIMRMVDRMEMIDDINDLVLLCNGSLT
jgi:2-methylcitrate dehydratase PrpD